MSYLRPIVMDIPFARQFNSLKQEVNMKKTERLQGTTVPEKYVVTVQEWVNFEFCGDVSIISVENHYGDIVVDLHQNYVFTKQKYGLVEKYIRGVVHGLITQGEAKE